MPAHLLDAQELVLLRGGMMKCQMHTNKPSPISRHNYQEKNMYEIFRKSISRMCQLLLYTLESYCGFVIIFILHFTFTFFTLFYAFICCKNRRQGHSAGAGKQSRAHINY